ncbi:hypothetical protein BGX30_011524 [Mortierella sp. GBA39]|nr:hypothetical protein BGX30_011524 [Mortierella sp. GBA39]
MDLFKSTFFRMSEAPPPAIHHPSRERPSPIDIPEILERVFYFTDDFTLRRTAVLVCRQWFDMNINRFSRTVYYKNDMGREQLGLVVSRLIGATRLHCYLTVDDMSRDTRNPFRLNIRNVIVNSQLGYQTLLEKRNQTATHKHKPAIHSFSPLREMVLDIVHYIGGSLDMFPFPETLTNVTLHIHSSDGGSINIGRILRQCPLLESLSIEIRMRDHNCLTWDEPMTLQRDLALRSFTVNHITLQHTKLLHILSSAPRLKVLKLIGMISSGLDLTLLCSHIKMLSLDLETFHFSTYDKTLTQDLQQQALEIYPVTAEWNLWASDMSPLLLKQLEVHTPCLTTLELHWQRKGNITEYERCRRSVEIITASRLHFVYLCNSPFAANLRSLKTGVFYLDMDVFGRGQPFDTSFSPAPQAPSTSPGIWRCRNLRVLHINLRDPMSSMKRRVQSRIVFGYIARVAPYLEDLEIYFPYFIVNRAPDHIYAAKLCMQLKGRFCLLGRLRYLQRLRVYALGGGITGLCQEMDLNGIVPSGRSDKFKELRQQEIASWQSLRLVEDQCNKAQQQQEDGDGSGDKDGSLDAEVRDQFRNLGLLMDVEEAINEIDGGSLVPFPSLTGLSFVYPILQGPEKALNQLFPKPKLGAVFEETETKNNNNNGTIKNHNNGTTTKNGNKEIATTIAFTIANTLTTNTNTHTADTTTVTHSALQQVNTRNPSPTTDRTTAAYSHPTAQPVNSPSPQPPRTPLPDILLP